MKNKDNKTIVGVDWLQIGGMFKWENETDEKGTFIVPYSESYVFCKKQDKRTKDFESIYNIQYAEPDTGELIDFACICTKWNFREKLGKDLHVLKVYNAVLYNYPIAKISDVINAVFRIKKIMRIDFCCDFLQFDDVLPEKFIAYAAAQKIHIKHKRTTSVVMQNGHYESVTVGSRKTPVRAYLYNKTKEIKQTGKTYIENMHNAILQTDGDVWRLEFSVLSPSQIMINDGETPNSYDDFNTIADLSLYEISDNLDTLYKCLYNKFWQWETNDTRRKSKNATPVINIRKTLYTVKRRKYADRTVKRTNKMILTAIMQLNQELRTMKIQQFDFEQVNYFVQSRGLANWAKERGIKIAELRDGSTTGHIK